MPKTLNQPVNLAWVSIAGYEDPPFANVREDDGLVITDTPGPLGQLGKAFVGYRTTYMNFNRKADAIKIDADLSPQGRTARLRQLATDTLASLDKIDTTFAKLDDARKKLTKRLEVTTGEGDPATLAIRRMEIRNWMRGMDPLQLQIEIEHAASAGDMSLFDALVSAPAYLVPKVDPSVVQRARTTLGEKRDPQAAAELRALDEADAIFQGARTSLRDHVTREGGLNTEPRVLGAQMP